MASAAQNTVRRSVKTCTECRQSKLKCDSRDRFPSPCSRCEAKQLFCNVDASFRRTPAKKRFEAMARELQELRSRRGWDGSHRHDSGTDTGPVGSASSDDHTVAEDGEDDFYFTASVVSLGEVFIEPQMAVDLFKTFTRLFRPQLPILGPLAMDRMYESYPFLFWTIVIVVLDHSPLSDHIQIARQLRPPYTRLLQQQLLEPPLPLHKVQALILVIEWPLAVRSQTHDPSYVYCGVAVQAARLMGLDRQHMLPPLRGPAGTLQSRINAWLGCFYVTTALSMHMGLPTLIESELDHSVIQDYLRQSTMPPVFTTRVRVQLTVSRFITLLNRDLGDPTALSLIRLLDSELTALRPEGLEGEAQARQVEFSVLNAKMHLYTLFIAKTPCDSLSRQVMIRTTFSVALRIINIATSGWHDRPDAKQDEAFVQRQRSFPKNRYRGLSLATVFLLKFFHNSPSASEEERQLAANHVCLAQEQFKTCSIGPEDEYARMSTLFEASARLKPEQKDPNKLRLTHRMGISILLDTVTNVDEVHGRPAVVPDDGAPEPTTAGMTATATADATTTATTTTTTTATMESSSDPMHDAYRQQYPEEYDAFGFGPAMMRELWNDPVLSMIDFDQQFYTMEY